MGKILRVDRCLARRYLMVELNSSGESYPEDQRESMGGHSLSTIGQDLRVAALTLMQLVMLLFWMPKKRHEV